MSTADFDDSDDEWLAEVLTYKGSPLIECYGRYGSDPTDSWHAHWIPNSCTVDVEAEWKITKSGKMKKFDIKLYISTDGDFSERSYDEITVKTFNISYDGIWHPEDATVIDASVTINGTKHNLGDCLIYDVAQGIRDIIKSQITSYLPTGMSGYKETWIEGGRDGRIDVDGNGNFDITSDDIRVEIHASGPSTGYVDGSDTLVAKALHTDQTQVYHRPFTAEQPNVITLSVYKETDGCSSNLFNLPMYNLRDVYFELYTSKYGSTRVKDIDGNYAVIDGFGRSGGLSDEVELPAELAHETIWLEEVMPSSAYGIIEPEGRFEVELPDAGEEIEVEIKNIPIHDPVSIIIQKKSNISKDKWIGDPILNGIEYTLEYYTTKSAAISGSSPTTTWKFETNTNGEIRFTNKSYWRSGTLYTQDGKIIYPLGYYRLYESTSSAVLHNRGLELNKDIYYLEVHNDGNDLGITTVYSDKFITKPGNVYNNDSDEATIYRLDTVNTFGTIEKEHWEPFAFVKKDIYLVSGKPEGDAQLEGTTFRLYSEDLDRFKCDGENLTEYDGNKYSINQDTGEVEVNGKTFLMTVDSNGAYKFPYPLPRTDFTNGSRFYIKEIDEQTGYQKSDIKYYIDFGSRTNGNTRTTVRDYNGNTISLEVKNMEDKTTSFTNSIYTVRPETSNITVGGVSTAYQQGTVYNTPIYGKFQIQKYDGDLDGIGKTQGDASLTGIKYAVINRSEKTVYYNDGKNIVSRSTANEYNPGEIVAIKSTGSTGHIDFGYFSYGTYDIVELRLDNTFTTHMNYDNSYTAHCGSSYLANASYVYTESKTVAEIGSETTYNVETQHTQIRNQASNDTFSYTNYAVKGTLVINKQDSETIWAQGDEDFADIRYAIINRSAKAVERKGEIYQVGEVVAIIKTDHDGIARLDKDGEFTLPYGTYDIVELRVDATLNPHDMYDDLADVAYGTSIYANITGFMYPETVEKATQNRSVRTASTATNTPKQTYNHIYKNAPAKGTLSLIKYDANLTTVSNKEFRQGDADTEGIRFAVINVSKDPQTGEPRSVKYKGVIYQPNTIIDIVEIKKEDNYAARLDKAGEFSLNYGTYLVYELREDCTIKIGEEYPVDNPADERLGTSIYSNKNGYLHNDRFTYDTSDLAMTDNGEVDYLKYDVVSGTAIIHEAQIERDYEFYNYPVRAEFWIRKFDDETDLQKNQGNNHFTHIYYAIVNKSQVHISYKNEIFEPNEIIDIVELDDTGNVHIKNIPYGTYDVHELRRDYDRDLIDKHKIYPTNSNDPALGTSIYANEWYLYCDDVLTKIIDKTTTGASYTVTSLNDKVRVAGNVYEFLFSNTPIRSDFEHGKFDIDGYRIPYIPFSVSLLDENGEILETHVIITDGKGHLNTQERSKLPKYINTLDQYYDAEHGRYTGPLNDEAALVNVWFGNWDDYSNRVPWDRNNDDVPDIINTARGSLLAGNYFIQELYCDNNQGQDMLLHTFSAFAERKVNEPENVAIDLNIIMKSNAYDYGTDSKTLSISPNAKIRDTVDITHLKVYNKYKLITEAVNVRKDGSWVSLGYSEPYIFTPDKYDETMTTYGTYDVIQEFDTTSCAPGTYVGLIDRLYEEVDGVWTDKPVRIHNGDLTDENQMLTVPELSTKAINLETGSLIGSLENKTKATDVISWKAIGNKSLVNLEIRMVDKDGNTLKDINNKDCCQNYFLYFNDKASETVKYLGNGVFIAHTTGEISMEEFELEPFVVPYTSDTIGFVVTMYDAGTGEVVISHNTDMTEAGEIIRYLQIGTTAMDSNGFEGIVPCDTEAEITDIISYSNLVQDAEVTVIGAVIDKSTGKVVTSNTGVYLISEGEGEIPLKFVLDTTPFAGKELVIFERVYLNYEDKLVLLAVHEDLSDKKQTVAVPTIKTTLMNVHNGLDYKITSAVEEQVTLVDYVEYTNLVPNKPWTLTARLMNAKTGKPVLDKNNNPVITIKTFTPSKSSGTEEVTFVFEQKIEKVKWEDEDVSWVCFEDVKAGAFDNIIYATHANLEDKDQTVYIPKFRTTAVDKTRGDHIIKADVNQVIQDTVEFKNFENVVTKGQEFTLKIEAHDAETGEEIVDENGVVYSNTKTFIWTGQTTETIDITINASGLVGKTIVFYETLYYGNSTKTDDRVLVEDDKDNPNQSVTIPAISTLATDKLTNSHNLSIGKIIVDKCTLGGLNTHTDYILKTIIMDKATGKPIKFSNGATYEVITPFNSGEHTYRTVDVTLDVSNTENIIDKDIVMFEYLYLTNNRSNLTDDLLVAKHDDINDKDQTIYVPSVHTTAKDAIDGDNVIDGTKTQQTIIDTVTYNNLIIGETYTVVGQLAVKSDNYYSNNTEYVRDDNNEIITVSHTFVATMTSGVIEIPFIVNASRYAGKKLVAFETLYYNDKPLVIHADINDSEQTTYVSLLLHVSLAKADFDDVGYFLKGAEITIFNQDGSIAKDINGFDCVGVTDENGAVDFVVTYDKNNIYYAQETKAPADYWLCEDKFEIHPSNDKEALGTDLIKIDILDEVMIIPPQQWGDNNTLIIAIIMLIISTLGLGTLLLIKIRKKKSR